MEHINQQNKKKPRCPKWLLDLSERWCSSPVYKTYRFFRNGYKNKKRKCKEWVAREILLNFVKPPSNGLNRQKRDREIIVSLTTYPARIKTVRLVLKQMLSQTLKPDRVLLYLAEEQFPDGRLPRWTKRFRDAGVECIFCKDLKPHKKYYFAMQQFPEAIIITVDDDLHYADDLVEVLYKSYLKFPRAISALRVHEITLDADGSILPYSQWNTCCQDYIGEPRMRLFATSGAGTLFPPHCLHPEAFNEKNIIETCLFADDLWLKVMSVLNGTQVVLAEAQRPIRYIDRTQETALWRENVDGGKNDSQLKMILERYNNFWGEGDSVIKRIMNGSP